MVIPVATWHSARAISFFLPINTIGELHAAKSILEIITDTFGGYTRSSMEKDAQMKGRYASGDTYIDDWVLHVVVITRDRNAARLTAEMHSRVHEEYLFQMSKQEAVWIVSREVDLFAE